ncbi:hypothetical protein K1719_028221 [Acacia pycnantha]|nr:hypothetical protein K1719_028221 [Acacia pycnantha]
MAPSLHQLVSSSSSSFWPQGTRMVAEARICESKNQRFRGPCIDSSSCDSVCLSEGFFGGHCRPFSCKFEMNKGKMPVKAEQGDSSEPTKEIMTFGSTVLVKHPPGHNKAY